MSPRIVSLAFIGIATLPLIGIGIVQSQIGPWLTSQDRQSAASRTEGGSRSDILMELTRLYVSINSDVPPAMKAGSELAPLDFLNEQLKLRGTKWRVRETTGLDADIYDIS